MQIQLPYGRTTIPFDAPSDRIISSRLSSRKPLAAGETLVQEAMRHPIGSATLAELAVIIHVQFPVGIFSRTCFMSCAPEAQISKSLFWLQPDAIVGQLPKNFS